MSVMGPPEHCRRYLKEGEHGDNVLDLRGVGPDDGRHECFRFNMVCFVSALGSDNYIRINVDVGQLSFSSFSKGT